MGQNIKETRAARAGKAMAEAIIEMVDLMYQNSTSVNFLRALMLPLKRELYTRKNRKVIDDEKLRKRRQERSGGKG